MQYYTILLNSLIVPSPNYLSMMHQHRANWYASFTETLFQMRLGRLVGNGLQKVIGHSTTEIDRRRLIDACEVPAPASVASSTLSPDISPTS